MLSIIGKIRIIASFFCIVVGPMFAMAEDEMVFQVQHGFEINQNYLDQISRFCEFHRGNVIVVVEDAPLNQKLLRRMLVPHPIIIFGSGTDLLRAEPQNFLAHSLVIILDNQMPGLKGIVVMKELQDRRFVEVTGRSTKPPVVFNSSDEDDPPDNLYFKRILLSEDKNNRQEILQVVTEIRGASGSATDNDLPPLVSAGSYSPQGGNVTSFRLPSISVGGVGSSSPKKENSISIRTPTGR